MLKRIFRYFTGIGVDKALQERAKQVREIARKFRLSVYPEILKDLEPCSHCQRLTLLLVYPYLSCYECFMGAVNEAHGEVFSKT